MRPTHFKNMAMMIRLRRLIYMYVDRNVTLCLNSTYFERYNLNTLKQNLFVRVLTPCWFKLPQVFHPTLLNMGDLEQILVRQNKIDNFSISHNFKGFSLMLFKLKFSHLLFKLLQMVWKVSYNFLYTVISFP
jgi:hypothetical protein